MNREHPVSSAPPHPPVWDSPDTVLRTGNLGSQLYVAALLLALPAYWLTLMATQPPGTHAPLAGDWLFFILALISASAAFCMLYWLTREAQGHGFCFDETKQCLTFTQSRPARAPTQEQVPYSAIHSIRPFQPTAFSSISHIDVCYALVDGKARSVRFWVHLTVADMALHAAWLRQSVGDRMRHVVDLDL